MIKELRNAVLDTSSEVEKFSNAGPLAKSKHAQAAVNHQLQVNALLFNAVLELITENEKLKVLLTEKGIMP